jgi:hypothetical protein
VGVDLAVRDTLEKLLGEACAAPGAAGTDACPAPPAPHVQRLSLSFPGFPDAAGVLALDDGSDEVALVAREPLSGARVVSQPAPGVWAGTADAARALRAALAPLPGFRGGAGLTVKPAAHRPPSTAATLSVSYDFSFAPDAFISFGGNPPALSCAGLLTPGGLVGGCTAPGCRPRHRQLRSTRVTPALPAGFAIDPVAVLLQPDAVPGTRFAPPAEGWAVKTALRLERTAPGRVAFAWADTAVFGVPAPGEDTELTPLPPAALRRPLKGPMGLLLQIAEDDDAQVMDDLHAAGAGGALGPWLLHFAWRLPSCTVTTLQSVAPAPTPAECSDRGVCDRAAGACKCFAGWAGTNCATAALTASV